VVVFDVLNVSGFSGGRTAQPRSVLSHLGNGWASTVESQVPAPAERRRCSIGYDGQAWREPHDR